MLAFLAINVVALAVAMGVHGAGFDDCEVAPTSAERATMAAIAASSAPAKVGAANAGGVAAANS